MYSITSHLIGDSRDSGVSENHSRQSSGPYSSEENENEPELLMNLPQQNIGTNSHYTGTNNGDQTLDDESRFQQIEKQIREQEVGPISATRNTNSPRDSPLIVYFPQIIKKPFIDNQLTKLYDGSMMIIQHDH